MEPRFFKIPVCVGDVTLRVAQGHFATRHSHINYFIDVTRQQSCLQEAEAVAQQLAQRLPYGWWTPSCAWTAPGSSAHALPGG